MSFFSSLKSLITSVASDIQSTAQRVWQTTKKVAAEALGWMADKAEAFVGSVKKVWNNVKPFIRPLVVAGKAIAPWPWLKKLLHALESTIELLENTSLAKKLDDAIRWIIQVARNLKDTILSKAEQAEARIRKALFSEAKALLPPEKGRVIQLAELVNTFVLVQTEIKNQIDSDTIKDFESYLRLRATQKLLRYTEQTLNQATDVDQISDEDIFLLEVGNKLIGSEPTLGNEDAKRIDAIIQARHGKSLISFVFEELVMAWWQNLAKLKEELKAKTDTLAKETIQWRLLKLEDKSSDLSQEEKSRLSQLSSRVPTLQAEEEYLAKKVREMSAFVFASEGLLQTLEQSPEQLEAEDKGYLKDEAAQVSKIIIDCAQHGKEWDTLTQEEQALITDYANIFKETSEARVKQLITVEVSA